MILFITESSGLNTQIANYLEEEHVFHSIFNNGFIGTYDQFLGKFTNDHFNRLYEAIQKFQPYCVIFVGNFLTKKFTGDFVETGFKTSIDDKIPAFTSRLSYEDVLQCIDLALQFKPVKQKTPYEIITTLGGVEKVISYVLQTKMFCFDFETTGLEWYKFPEQKPTILSVSVQAGYSYIIPLYHPESPFSENDIKFIIGLFKSMVFENSSIIKVGQNVKFDLHWFRVMGVDIVLGEVHDTKLMHSIIDDNGKHGLKSMTTRYFKQFSGYEENIDYNGELEQLADYAAIDTDMTIRLYYWFSKLLKDDMQLYCLYRNLTCFALKAIYQAESNGAYIDRELIESSIQQADIYIDELELELNSYVEVQQYQASVTKNNNDNRIAKLTESYNKAKLKFEDSRTKKVDKLLLEISDLEQDPSKSKMVNSRKAKIEKLNSENGSKSMMNYLNEINAIKKGEVVLTHEVNLGSSKQLSSILYDFFEFPERINSYSGSPERTTERSYIKELNHPFIEALMSLRSIKKMKSTYYEGILKRLSPEGKLHVDFNISGTVTGRLSSFLHVMPKRTTLKDERVKWALGQVLRFFVNKSEDYVMLQADYSQAELRVIANYANDPTMKDAYRQGIDIHALTGSRIYGCSLNEFYELDKDTQKHYRTMAKGANFGWVYKQTEDGYVEYLKNTYGVEINHKQAKDHKRAIFDTYKTLRDWHNKYERIVRTSGHVTTLFGRRRRLPDIHLPEEGRTKSFVNKAIRNAVNSPIQGTGGEFAIFCIALLHRRLPQDCIFFNTVHDSVFYYVPKNRLQETIEIINHTCSNPPIQEYFHYLQDYYADGAIPMKMDFELSETNWSEMKEI